MVEAGIPEPKSDRRAAPAAKTEKAVAASSRAASRRGWLHREGRSSFPDAVEDAAVDFAFIGSLWHETFYLVAYEAVAGGAEILIYVIPGQSALMARQGHGHVFGGLTDLIAFVDELLARCDGRSSRNIFNMDVSENTPPGYGGKPPQQAVSVASCSRAERA